MNHRLINILVIYIVELLVQIQGWVSKVRQAHLIYIYLKVDVELSTTWGFTQFVNAWARHSGGAKSEFPNFQTPKTILSFHFHSKILTGSCSSPFLTLMTEFL